MSDIHTSSNPFWKADRRAVQSDKHIIVRMLQSMPFISRRMMDNVEREILEIRILDFLAELQQ